MAQAEGYRPPQAKPPEKGESAAVFGIEVNDELFAEFETWGCEESEKAQLRKLETELDQYRDSFKEKGAEWKQWVDKARSAHRTIQERMKKKRKGDDGLPRAEPSSGSGESAPVATAAPPAGEGAAGGTKDEAPTAECEAALKVAAERLSQQKFLARAAVDATAAKGGGKGASKSDE